MMAKKFRYLRYNCEKFIRKIPLKKLLLTLLFGASLFADAKIYIGGAYGLYNESYAYSASALPDTTDNALKLKVGYGMRDSYAVEFSLDYIDHADYNNHKATGKAKYGFNVALMKAYDWGIYINPYIKAGFGAGILDNKGNTEQSLTYGSFDAATGFFLPINESYDLELSYEYKHLTYEKQQILDSSIRNESHVNTLYLGFNVRF